MTTTVKAVSERVSKLREKMLVMPSICVERGYWMTESYKETESEPIIIRRAKALKKILEQMTIFIEDGELIVGNATSKTVGAIIRPEVQWEWYLEEMDTVSMRDWDKFAPLAEEEKEKMKGFLPYWKGKALYDKWLAMIPEDALRLNHKIQAAAAFGANNQHYGHIAVDNASVLARGLNGIKKQVEEELKKPTFANLAKLEELEKYQFLKAVNITLEAAISFAGRYAELARSMAAKETDAQRKAELEKIAETCDWVPANPARSFYEALQSVWLTHVVVMVESWGAGMSFGRPDQYFYPFYKKDIEGGKITREEARELVALFLIKNNTFGDARGEEAARYFAGAGGQSSTTLGGVNADGQDAVNELSYLFLDAETDVRLKEDFIIRIHKNTADAFLMKACEVAKMLRGKIKFVGDETNVQRLLSDGKPLEYARDYMVTGCNSPGVPARSLDIPGGIFNLPLMMELALNNGVSRLTGEQLGPKTGDPRQFKSYDEVLNAYKRQVEALIPVALIFKNTDKQLFAQYYPLPFQSALFSSCIESGLDITNGGTAPYISHGTSLGGAPNVGDSLAAIRKAVFEDKKITMDRLIDALDKNFEGEEEVLHILNSAPKFGNDDDYVDSIVNEVLMHAANEVSKVRGFKGAVSTSAAGTITTNVPLGYVVGALPDGRKAGEPISEGGISPHQGRNVSGPTATMRSVAKLNHAKVTNGSVLNMRFSPDSLKDESKMRKFASMIRTFLESGGGLVQFNIVGTETLRDAQKNPEKYKDLLVRVATYSAYFVELSPDLQNDIIARMEFEEV